MVNQSQLDSELPHDAPRRAEAAPSPQAESFFFCTPAVEGLLGHLAHSIQHKAGICVLEGPNNSGKTTLAALLCRKYLPFSPYVGLVVAPLRSDPRTLLRAVSNAFHLPVDPAQPPSELLVGLRRFVQMLKAQSQAAVLVIDDAQNLDPRVLLALASLARVGAKPACGLRLVLVSEIDSLGHLDNLELGDTPIHEFDMPLLARAEVDTYLKQYHTPPGRRRPTRSFKPAEIQRVWVESGGCIGLIPELVGGAPQQKSSSSAFAGLPAGHLVVLSVLVVLLIGVVVTRGTDSGPSTLEGKEELKAEVSQPQPIVPQANTQAPTTASADPSMSLDPVIDPRDLHQVHYGQTTAEVEVETDVKEKSAPSSADVSPSLLDSEDAGKLAVSAQLRALDPSSYSLQVMAASSRESLERVRDAQPEGLPLYLYETRRDGKQWFVLLAGNYSARETAIRAIDELPQALRSGGAWPRKLETIHAEIGDDSSY